MNTSLHLGMVLPPSKLSLIAMRRREVNYASLLCDQGIFHQEVEFVHGSGRREQRVHIRLDRCHLPAANLATLAGARRQLCWRTSANPSAYTLEPEDSGLRFCWLHRFLLFSILCLRFIRSHRQPDRQERVSHSVFVCDDASEGSSALLRASEEQGVVHGPRNHLSILVPLIFHIAAVCLHRNLDTTLSKLECQRIVLGGHLNLCGKWTRFKLTFCRSRILRSPLLSLRYFLQVDVNLVL
mmetsp:Transcript_5526/g.8803  ORF Transcript_5526/g.8803 Transcript_5526/m.8803 type:complete len:240 (-) Transcript_5526:850-1569(-)